MMQKDIEELLQQGVIDEKTAEKIYTYYRNKNKNFDNPLFIVFGILGAILVGLGLILIIAHNWDHLSRYVKTIIVFIPLFISQVICAYTLLKKTESITWRESSSVLLIFSVGASISLISQIYHIQGDIGLFLLTWILLVLPLVYIMNSGIASLLLITGITAYGAYTGYDSTEYGIIYYVLLMVAVLPFYFHKISTAKTSLFTFLHHWFIPLSVIINLGALADRNEEWMFVAYMSLFGIYLQLSALSFIKDLHWFANGYRVSGFTGTLFILMLLSFQGIWENLINTHSLHNVFTSIEFWLSVILTSIGLFLTFRINKLKEIPFFNVIFIIFFVLFVIGFYSKISVYLINFMILALGINTVIQSLQKNLLGQLNLGLSILTILIICRFFDTNIPFIVRGLLFLFIGFGFFGANYYMLKKRKHHDSF